MVEIVLSVFGPLHRDIPYLRFMISPVGDGSKTVDVQQIRGRFKSLGINTHWDRIDRIRDFRNNIKHYYSNLSKDSVYELLSNSFIVIRDFIVEELSLNPSDLLGTKSWNTLVSVSEVYQKEKQSCENEIDKIEWGSELLGDALKGATCTNCGSGLINPKSIQERREDVVLAGGSGKSVQLYTSCNGANFCRSNKVFAESDRYYNDG